MGSRSLYVKTVNCVLLFLLYSTAYRTCPPDFKDVGDGVCMIHLPLAATYCAAHQLCKVEGKKRGLRLFVSGIHAERIPKFFPDIKTVFTSLHAMLNRSSDLQAGWRVGDPGFADHETGNNDNSIRWYSKEPDESYEAIALYENGVLVDNKQKSRNASDVICELSNQSHTGSFERFVINWPYSFHSVYLQHNSNTGCFTSIVTPGLLSCGFQQRFCRGNPPTIVRSIGDTMFLNVHIDNLTAGDQFILYYKAADSFSIPIEKYSANEAQSSVQCVELGEGTDATAANGVVYCGDEMSHVQFGDSEVIRIWIRANNLNAGAQFAMEAMEFDPQAACDQYLETFDGTEKVFQFPTADLVPAHPVECSYTILTVKRRQIRVHITDISIFWSSNEQRIKSVFRFKGSL
ncbi:unnamed protein product [Echinostoma caproni]|uniref:CUB domain-containing protein n=1 Tax=Echinostoma caproni TaxID=27848 RepID=A0A183ATY4_9TREM|nr:unnamed protein product [Echinostoma caproni]